MDPVGICDPTGSDVELELDLPGAGETGLDGLTFDPGAVSRVHPEAGAEGQLLRAYYRVVYASMYAVMGGTTPCFSINAATSGGGAVIIACAASRS